MHESLIQRGCEVAEAVNAFAIAQGFGKGGPKSERWKKAQAGSQHQSGRAGGMLALKAASGQHPVSASPCCASSMVQGTSHSALVLYTMPMVVSHSMLGPAGGIAAA